MMSNEEDFSWGNLPDWIPEKDKSFWEMAVVEVCESLNIKYATKESINCYELHRKEELACTPQVKELFKLMRAMEDITTLEILTMDEIEYCNSHPYNERTLEIQRKIWRA